MNEVAQRTPEFAQYWKPKRKPQTMEDIDKTAQFQKELREDIERYFEKQARHQQEKPKDSYMGLFLALLGVILTSGAEYVSEGTQKS